MHALIRSFPLAAALLAALPAGAADLGPATPVATPSMAERLAGARRAIGAQEWGAALRELTVAAREEPDNPDVHNLLGYTYRKQARPDLTRAVEHYQAALRLDPRHKGAHEYLGEAYLMQRRPADAERHLAELERICGGRACEEYQELAKAIEAYQARH
jgi:tetratricopeptide (TPR) repeat protein